MEKLAETTISQPFGIPGGYLWDRALARSIDHLSSAQYLIPSIVFMESAGKAVAEAVLTLATKQSPILILCGPGSNGGDSLVAARHLHEAGYAVHIFLVWDEAKKPNAACQQQMQILLALGHSLNRYQAGVLAPFAQTQALIIDGVLGLGFEGPLREETVIFAALTEAAGISNAKVVAIDVPSGLDGDAGELQDIPLRADMTVTFGGLKPAHVLSPARDLCGQICDVDIGFPEAAYHASLNLHQPRLFLPDAQALLSIDPWSKLSPSAHKYDRGHVLIIGGSTGKTGAPLLAAMAALRAGAGWATLAMPQSAFDSLRGDVPRELTFEEIFDGDQLNAIKLEQFLEERRVRAVVCGPGAMTNPLTPEAIAVLSDFTSQKIGSVILDAGATHGLQDLLATSPQDPERWLALPHPGEWQRLGPNFPVNPLRPETHKQAAHSARDLGVALLYKHATPILFSGQQDSAAFVCNEGDISLARAGSGDLLAGVAGAHAAIGMTSVLAALRSQILIAWAAKLASQDLGLHAVTASDIIGYLGRVGLEVSQALIRNESFEN